MSSFSLVLTRQIIVTIVINIATNITTQWILITSVNSLARETLIMCLIPPTVTVSLHWILEIGSQTFSSAYNEIFRYSYSFISSLASAKTPKMSTEHEQNRIISD